DLCDYLRHLQTMKTSINWNVIKPECVESAPHGDKRGLQVADVVASSFWAAVEPNRFGNTEPRYAKHLLSRVYHRKGRVESYGIKVYPSVPFKETEQIKSLLEQ